MPKPPLPLEGGCRCGRVRFRVTAAPMMTSACHCTGCQRMTSSAYSLTAMFPAQAFEVIAGEPVVGGLREPPVHHHCGFCMSWVFTRLPMAPQFVNVRASLFDETAWFTPFMETYTSEKLAWAEVPAVKSFAKFPETGEYQGLMAAYVAAQA